MKYVVELDVYRGANVVADSHEDYTVDAEDRFTALSKAEQHLNVLLPDAYYCVARQTKPTPIKFNAPVLLAAA